MSRKRLSRVVAVGAVLSLATGLLVAATTVAPVQAAPSAITWTTCADVSLRNSGLQCGSLLVPLDRARPDGPQVRLALTRKRHTGSTYRGVMLINPGGPGGSGLSLPTLSDAVPAGAGAAYDWIGFDPRGVGASRPALSCIPRYNGVDRPRYTPAGKKRITRYWLRKSASYSAACASTASERALLPHLTTVDTVQDMDDIRAALGASKLNYYGFSYGTYLGQVYATRYPSRVGRFVLDGVVDPGRVWYAANVDQDRAFDRNIKVYFRYLAAHPRAFKLGRSWKQIRRGYYAELRRLDRRPAAGGRLGPAELTDAMLSAAYYVYEWDEIGRDYSRLKRTHRGGAMLRRYLSSVAGGDNSYAMYLATECTDATWPSAGRMVSDARAVNRRHPFLTWSNTWFNMPCASWAAPSVGRPVVSGAGLTQKILLISETRDAATPYTGALHARSLFPSASLVAGVGGTTHSSSLSGVACVDNTIATYLRTGAVPARRSGTPADRACPRLAPPYAAGRYARGSSTSTDPLAGPLRDALMAAQRGGR